MTTYTFDVTIDGFDMDNPRHHAALENLPFWVYPSESDGEVTATVTIEAESPARAVVGAQRLMDRVGFAMRRIDLGLVGVSGIAEELGCNRETARLYARGDRRSGSNFPVHWTVIGGAKVWAWSEVCDWALREGLLTLEDLGEVVPLPARVVERFNGGLAAKRSRDEDGWGVFRKSTSRPADGGRSPQVRTDSVALISGLCSADAASLYIFESLPSSMGVGGRVVHRRLRREVLVQSHGQ